MTVESQRFTPNDQYRNCCWTLNNYTPEDVATIKTWTCKYIVFGFEKGEQNTPHLQGYVEWKTPKKGSTCMNLLNKRIHWECRHGTAEEAAKYCMKGEQPKDEWKAQQWNGPHWGLNAVTFEAGTMSAPGKRTDLDTIGHEVLAGKPIKEIAAENPGLFIKYHKGIEALRASQYEHRTTKPYVEWRWGLAGVGKTRKVYDDHKTVYKKDNSKWWDRYTQEEAIVVDDFNGRWPFRDLLMTLDRYPHSGEIKGGYIPINSPYIYITCEFPPDHFWGITAIRRVDADTESVGSANELNQIMRRIDKVVHVE